MRCLYCHNAALVLNPDENSLIPEEDFFAFLDKRKRILQGVCITGGEPTIQKDLKDFIKKIREKGYPVKLDTNGLRPDILKDLIDEGLINMAAMDVKTDRERYPALTGLTGQELYRLDESISLLKEERTDYEFRTTVVREFFDEKAAENIGKWLEGSKALFLQGFVDSPSVMTKGLHGCTGEEMEGFKKILSGYIKRVELRGVD